MTEIYKRVVESIKVSSKNRTKIFSIVFCLVFFGAMVCAFGSSSVSIASDITIDNVVELTNQSRTDAGETALALNAKLSQAAEAKAEDMIAKNYFSHTSPEGATPWVWIDKANYDYNYAGENLAMDFHSSEKMEDAWMASPTHRANILNDKYLEIGVAVKEGNLNGHDTILTVVMFGSGDKNLSSAIDAKKASLSVAEETKAGKNIPSLPAGEKRKEAVVFDSPMITSPQPEEIISGSEIKIAGRARPGETVMLYDNENFADTVVADSSGWFSSTEKNLSEGGHQLTLKDKKNISVADTEFYVDRSAPDVDFRLYADENDPRKLFLEASADKNNCIFQFDGETRQVAQAGTALFSIDADKSSAILRIADQAGNKNFKQINIANYYSPEKRNNISEKLAALLAPRENIYAANSGREAVKNNLGLAMGGLNNN